MTVFRYNPNIYIGSLAQAAVDRAVAHAAREFPREACGAIIGDNYHEFVNVAAALFPGPARPAAAARTRHPLPDYQPEE